jgi:decaprenyl-phosphate phosphoribosyltransferase
MHETADGKPSPVAQFRRPQRGVRVWIRAFRVRQWTKNVLVFAAPAAAGVLGHPGVVARTSAAFVAFCLLATGVYLINDARDAAEDRHHAVKRHRPIASGAISARRAVIVGCAAMLMGIGVAAAVNLGLLAVACGYVCLNLSYTTWLRSVALADIATIAAAFVLRAVAGGVAAGVSISPWFILVVSFVALFVAAGKRYADLLDPASRRSRRVLEQYTARSLRLVIGAALAAALVSYAVWAFGVSRSGLVLWDELTIIPFTLALLRYRLHVSAGRGGAPEAVMFNDRFMQLLGAAWLVTFLLGV